MKNKIFLFVFVLCGVAVLRLPVKAACDTSECSGQEDCEKKQQECVDSIGQLQGQILDYNQQIKLMDDRVRLTSIKIAQTEIEITGLEGEIASLSGKIVRLDVSLNDLSKALLFRIVETYKAGKTNSAFVLFSSDNLSSFVNSYHYLQAVQFHDRELLITMEQTRTSYDEQKSLKEQAQIRLEKLKVRMKNDKVVLARQIKEKEDLLGETQNSKRKYEDILAKINAEISSLKGFTEKQEGGILPPQSSPDGWYYSQRDSRWAGNLIGYSKETIFDVGCLISGVAMINAFYGNRVTPADIAGNPNNFFLQTAYMRVDSWVVPPGRGVYNVAGGLSGLDAELNEGRPVVVHLKLGGDGHFIVLKKKEGNDYIMHDPWEGYDKKFSDFYSIGSIDTGNMRTIK